MGFFKKAQDAQHWLGDSMPRPADAIAAIGARTAPADVAERLRFAQLSQKLMVSGVDAPAVINTVTCDESAPTGAAVPSIYTVFEVTIKPADGEAYAATVKQWMSPAMLEALPVGTAISVRYDSDDRTQAIIYHW